MWGVVWVGGLVGLRVGGIVDEGLESSLEEGGGRRLYVLCLNNTHHAGLVLEQRGIYRR